GELTPSQSGALLMGLRMKGETARELGAGVEAALAQARLVPGLSGRRIDTCGTGGDNSCSFNCSTAVSLVLAGMGYQVVKHGNRAISSKCGSADVVEALGMPITLGPEEAAEELRRRNFVFLFAPNFHPAFRFVMPVRKELGCRTLFNLMGPLLNPARPTHQLLGVPNPKIMPLMAEVLLMGGVKRACVVHGAGGFDELTPFGPAEVVWVRDGRLVPDTLDPGALGFARHSPEDVAVSGKPMALAVIQELLAGGGPEAMRDMLLFNLAVAVHLLEENVSIEEGLDRARTALDQGAGRKTTHA
ncbi:MAG: anthranilate phosphoribosyltransferase, partial [Desulfovibrionales bacterium]